MLLLGVCTGGLTHLYAALDTHSTSEDLVQVIVTVIANISKTPDCAIDVNSSGGSARILQVMNSFPSSTAVLQRCCIAICNISVLEACARDLVRAGAGSAVCVALAAHPRSGRVAQWACASLRNLSAYSQSCCKGDTLCTCKPVWLSHALLFTVTVLVDAGALPLVLTSLLGYLSSPDVQEQG